MKTYLLAMTGALCLVGCGDGKMATKPGKDRDNAGVNVRDRDGDTKTPLDQNENKADIDTTAKIRKLVMGTKMSTNAHNVKIVTQDGHVTLRGPVKSDDEKAQIAKFAEAVAGKDHVDNQIEVEDAP